MKTTRTGQLAGSTAHAITASAVISAAPTPSKLSRHLLASAAALALLVGSVPAAHAGGDGGSSQSSGLAFGGVGGEQGNPGLDSGDGALGGPAGTGAGGDGGNGEDAGSTHTGGGGGGGGNVGNLGSSATVNTSALRGGDGGKGGDATGGGGGGGGDAGDGADFTTDATNDTGGTIRGGDGGAGGIGGLGGGSPNDAGSGSAGSGGYGVFTIGNFINNGTITGGNGGNSPSPLGTGSSGEGGDGGYGIDFEGTTGGQINNTGTIIGGNGGTGVVDSDGGIGIRSGSSGGLEIENLGAISGGLNSDGTRADAIQFNGDNNSLLLEAGSQITGNVVAGGTNNQLGVETNGGNNSSFDVSQLGAIASSSQYQGFSFFVTTNLNPSQGVGTVTLTGTTTETLTWVIDSLTTMAISSDSTLGAAGSTIMLNGGTLKATADINLSRNVDVNSTTSSAIDTMSHKVTMSGQISGNSSVAWHKLGTGTLTIDSDSSAYAGTTEIDVGTVQVGDVNHQGTQADLGGNVVVNAGATLSGYGSLGDVTNIDGIVVPGGLGMSDADIGTMNVNSYTPGANSTLRILMTPNGNSNLAISGSAMTHLDGRLDLRFAPGVYAGNSRTVLIANNLYDGSFDSVTSNASFSTTLDTSDSQTVRVDLAGGTVTSVTVAPTDGHVIGAATSSLVSGTQIANQSLFDHLSDQRQGVEDDALHTAFAGGNPAQLAFAGDMAALNDIVASLPQAIAKNGGWFRALGGFGNIDGSNGAPGVDSYGGGFMAGYDRALTDNLLVGIAAGYTRTAIDDNDHSSATIDTPRVSLYSSYHLGGFALDGSVGYAFDRIKSHDISDGGDAKSKRDANEITAALQASYNLNLPNAFVLTPHAGLDYLHIFEQGFNEHGAGAFDLQAQGNDTDSLRPQVGVGASRNFATDNGWHLIPQVDLTYSREVLDNSHNANVTVGGGSFTVDGLSPSRDQLALNVDLTAQLNDNVDLSLGYTQVLPVGNTTSYNFTGGVHVLF